MEGIFVVFAMERRMFSCVLLLRKMIQHLFGKQPSSFHRYLVQQGIRLIRYKGRPVDFRVHMNKDRNGKWKVVGIGAKAAGSGSITTHVRTGGSLFPGQPIAAVDLWHECSFSNDRPAKSLNSDCRGLRGKDKWSTGGARDGYWCRSGRKDLVIRG